MRGSTGFWRSGCERFTGSPRDEKKKKVLKTGVQSIHYENQIQW